MSCQPFFGPFGGVCLEISYIIDTQAVRVWGLLNMYQSEVIHNALIAAHVRGVDVQIICDRRQQFLANPRLDELKAHGIPVHLDKHERSIQSQYLVLDTPIIVTGRFLYTYTHDDVYACDAIYIEDTDAWFPYKEDWNYHHAHSEQY